MFKPRPHHGGMIDVAVTSLLNFLSACRQSESTREDGFFSIRMPPFDLACGAMHGWIVDICLAWYVKFLGTSMYEERAPT